MQDAAWEGYENPAVDYAGLGTLMLEAIRPAASVAPTHIFVQAGVGSFAGMVSGNGDGSLGGRRPNSDRPANLNVPILYRSPLKRWM